MSASPRAVITGLGVFSPLGCHLDVIKERLLGGETGLRPVERFESFATPGGIGAELRDYDQSAFRKTLLKPIRRNAKVMCREIEFGVATAASALEDSGVVGKVESERLGIDFGANLMVTAAREFHDQSLACVDESGEFEISNWGPVGMGMMEPLWLLKYLPNMPACHIGILADARGPNNSLTQEEASTNLVIGEAVRILERGWADAMITGTTGTRLDEMKSVHARMWDDLGYWEADPSRSCRPFDKDRSGQVIGDGSGVFILEKPEHAQAREAKCWGKVLGTGSSCVGSRGGDQPGFQKAMARAMTASIRDAGLTPDDVGHINAHGLGSTVTDLAEAKAIHDVFGDRGAEIPVTALKSRVGNAGASCGAVELGLSLLAAQEGVIPATFGCDSVDPDCNLNVVTNEPTSLPNQIMVSVNVTRLGQASAVVVELG